MRLATQHARSGRRELQLQQRPTLFGLQHDTKPMPPEISMQVPSPAELCSIFELDRESFATLAELPVDELPEPYRTLLAHTDHMTVAMESRHACPVDVEVLQVHNKPPIYTREILLRRESDRQIVQYGIASLNLDCFPEPVQQEILAQTTPLGRILISNELFRQVELGAVWEVNTGPDFRSRCETETETTFGRTALIHLDGSPAIRLLEIVIEPTTSH